MSLATEFLRVIQSAAARAGSAVGRGENERDNDITEPTPTRYEPPGDLAYNEPAVRVWVDEAEDAPDSVTPHRCPGGLHYYDVPLAGLRDDHEPDSVVFVEDLHSPVHPYGLMAEATAYKAAQAWTATTAARAGLDGSPHPCLSTKYDPPDKYSDIDFVPPEAAQENAQQALDWKDEHGDEVEGGTQVGWRRARQIVSGERLTPDTIARIAGFERHEDNAPVDEQHEGEPWKDAGHVAWYLWGGDEGVEWAQDVLDQMEEADEAAPADHKAATPAQWVPYEGPQGGTGWRNPASDEVIYQEEPPGEVAGDLDAEQAREALADQRPDETREKVLSAIDRHSDVVEQVLSDVDVSNTESKVVTRNTDSRFERLSTREAAKMRESLSDAVDDPEAVDRLWRGLQQTKESAVGDAATYMEALAKKTFGFDSQVYGGDVDDYEFGESERAVMAAWAAVSQGVFEESLGEDHDLHRGVSEEGAASFAASFFADPEADEFSVEETTTANYTPSEAVANDFSHGGLRITETDPTPLCANDMIRGKYTQMGSGEGEVWLHGGSQGAGPEDIQVGEISEGFWIFGDTKPVMLADVQQPIDEMDERAIEALSPHAEALLERARSGEMEIPRAAAENLARFFERVAEVTGGGFLGGESVDVDELATKQGADIELTDAASVDWLARGRERVGSLDKAATKLWVPYEGPRGGTGWRNVKTGRVEYQEDPPGRAPDSEEELKEELRQLGVEVGTSPGPAATGSTEEPLIVTLAEDANTFAVEGEPAPPILVERGAELCLSAQNLDGHPLYISEQAGGGGYRRPVEDGVTVTGSVDEEHATVDGRISLSVSNDTPTLFYACTEYEGMGGRIEPVEPGDVTSGVAAIAQKADPRPAAGAPVSRGDRFYDSLNDNTVTVTAVEDGIATVEDENGAAWKEPADEVAENVAEGQWEPREGGSEKASVWTRYRGPLGGTGWRNERTGNILYQDTHPALGTGEDAGLDKETGREAERAVDSADSAEAVAEAAASALDGSDAEDLLEATTTSTGDPKPGQVATEAIERAIEEVRGTRTGSEHVEDVMGALAGMDSEGGDTGRETGNDDGAYDALDEMDDPGPVAEAVAEPLPETEPGDLLEAVDGEPTPLAVADEAFGRAFDAGPPAANNPYTDAVTDAIKEMGRGDGGAA